MLQLSASRRVPVSHSESAVVATGRRGLSLSVKDQAVASSAAFSSGTFDEFDIDSGYAASTPKGMVVAVYWMVIFRADDDRSIAHWHLVSFHVYPSLAR